MKHVCGLCHLKDANKTVSNNEEFLIMVRNLYSIQIPDYSIKVCNDCYGKTVKFDFQRKCVAMKQRIHTETMEMYRLANKEPERLCRFCTNGDGEIDITKLGNVNSFISEFYNINVDSSIDDCLKYLCTECFRNAAELNAYRKSVIEGNQLFQQIGPAAQSVFTDEYVRNDYEFAPATPIRRGSSNSTVYDESNPLEGFHSAPPSVGSSKYMKKGKNKSLRSYVLVRNLLRSKKL